MHGINNFWMRGLIVVVMSVVVCAVADAQVSYPVGTVIEVTDDGVVVTAPEEVTEEVVKEPVVYVDESEYCYGADYALVDCDPSQNYDPWIASTGEKHYWIRSGLTFAIPFTLPSRESASDTRYGFFQMTSPEVKRDVYTEDVFRVWFSEEPNGVPLDGSGGKCEKWMVRAKGYLYWTQDPDLATDAGVCFLGNSEKVLYANFETACYAPRYEGQCSDNNKQKSYSPYQFDVARGVRGY